ncbi:hypothetical protein D5952_14270 [Salmonella enterica subsp. enterica]|nr:hypothetical protein [Salmonella enterica subsp. enterica serovar Bonn]EBZ5939346.1 hypothetical protein [Salmonella enterica subsp. enterica serovar Muenchen]MLZ41089.1 hypothetical protein [Salmonella enterica subsp. enterica serovar Bonn]
MTSEELLLEFGKAEMLGDLIFDRNGFIRLNANDVFPILIENCDAEEFFVRVILCEINRDKVEGCVHRLLSINMQLINCGAYIYWNEQTNMLGISKILSVKGLSPQHLSTLITILLLEAEGVMNELDM